MSFFSFKMYFPKHAWQDPAFFPQSVRCILLANLGLNTAQIIEKTCMHKDLFSSTGSAPSHPTWWLCVHHGRGGCHCVVVGGGWWGERICSRGSCLFCKWLKLSTQDNENFWSFCTKIKVKYMQGNTNEAFVLQVHLHSCLIFLYYLVQCSVFFSFF